MAREFLSRIQNKRDTSANWTKNNPVILNGEIILVDTAEGELRAKIGDGTKTYTQLPFSDEALKSLINTVAQNAERNVIVGIQKNGTDISVNASTRKVNITVPIKTSELTNDSSFIKGPFLTEGEVDTICGTAVANASNLTY